MWCLLHVPSIFANGFCVVWKKRKKILVSCWSIRKHVFKSVELRGRKRSGFPPALPVMSPKEGISLGYMVWEVSEAGWIEHASLQWSEALVAIQTQINRGGTLELMIEEGGGGVSEGGLSAPEPQSPKAWEVKDRCALRTLPDPAQDGTPTPLQLSPPNFFASFHDFSRPATSLQSSETPELSAWLHEKFHGLGTLENF